MPWTHEELAAMYAEAVRAKHDVIEVQRLGGNPAKLMNDIFDADIVFGMWPKKRGGIGYLPVKGIDHLLRVSESRQSERLRLSTYDFNTADAAEAVAYFYAAFPHATWKQAFVDGKPFGWQLTAD